MTTKKSRKTATINADDTPIPALIMMLILSGLLLALAIALHFYPLSPTTQPSPAQRIGHMVIVSNSPIPSGIVAYVPITLGNPSNTTMPPIVAITINISKYSSYLSQNQSNLEFYYELPSWPESNSSSSMQKVFFYETLNYSTIPINSTAITARIELPSSMSPNSNKTIYMGFKRD
jgi:hypothetical protein